MQFIADLHLHSKYSRAVSQNMIPSTMAQIGKQKGIDMLATGDWTHPLWYRDIRNFLIEAEEGLFKINKPADENHETRFILSVEISNIFTQGGKGRRIHSLILSPSFETSDKINKELIKRGCNLTADGRPIIGLSAKNLLELVLAIDSRCLFIPCHVWTPWFGLYGMNSGFESIKSCFEELSEYIYGIETGLSSDPQMNWQMTELNTRSILSFSDAHSPAKMGREVTVFNLEELSYTALREAIMSPFLRSQGKTVINKVLYTIEFYPEEGKYHYSGHRNCKITMTPEEQRASNGICPVCKRRVTDGVMRRVQELANEEPRGKKTIMNTGITWFNDPKRENPPFIKMVPLLEIVGEVVGTQVTSIKAKKLYTLLCDNLGSEINILLKVPIKDIENVGGKKIAGAIQKVREGNISIQPGYDGIYGMVKILSEKSEQKLRKIHSTQ